MRTLSASAIAIAPPDPPSPITQATVGTFSRAIVACECAIAAPWPCCSNQSSSRRSPEIFAPPSSGRFLNLPSRSRRRSSCSVGGIEEPQQAGKGVAQLGARDDRVDLAEAEVLLGAPEVVGQLLARDLLHDARAGK